MRSLTRFLGPTFLVIGALLLGEAFATGAARLYLLVIVPVVTGTTLIFGVSVAFLVLGFLFLPFVFAGAESAEPSVASTGSPTLGAPPTEGGSGGLILVGPVPIFFGAWRRRPSISYRWALLLGVVLAVVAVLLLWAGSVL
jgi:uncharacterized membrane protein